MNYTTTAINATAGSDYTPTSGTLSFAPNSTFVAISIPILNDNINESLEAFTVTLSNPVNAKLGANANIGEVTISDTWYSGLTFTLPNGVENLTLIGNNAINGTGNSGNNILTGNRAKNIMNGGTGVDTLTGDAGADTFMVTSTAAITDLGNGGADVLNVAKGGIANATINSAWTATADTINNGTVNIITAGLAVNLSAVTKGTSGYKITDTGGATKLIGSALGDLIIGGTGNDTLAGGLGNDTLTGGTGNDFFVFNTQPNNKTNVDLMTDFVSGKDHLQLSKAIFAGLNTAAGTGNGSSLNTTEFVSSKTVIQGTTATSHLIYNSTSGILYYDADANSKGAAVELAILGTTTHPALVAADILIIA